MAKMDVEAENDTPQVVNLSQVRVGTVQAELVRASEASIQSVQAEELDATEALIGSAATGTLSGHKIIVGAVNSQQANLNQALIGGLRGETVTVSGTSGLLVAETVNAAEANALTMVGAEINATHIRAGLVIGRQVNGKVETLLEARTALLAGVLGGVAAGLILLAGRLLFGRKK
jgi:hypothetical protein